MSGRLGPNVAVLVIGPTIAKSLHLVGRRGVIERWVQYGDATDHGAFAAGDGWRVEFDHPTSEAHGIWPQSHHAIFPATSLMPLDGQAEPEAITAGEPVGAEVSHAD